VSKVIKYPDCRNVKKEKHSTSFHANKPASYIMRTQITILAFFQTIFHALSEVLIQMA
jgi:hypothetical protein